MADHQGSIEIHDQLSYFIIVITLNMFTFYTFTDEPRFPYKNGVYYNAGEVTLAYPSLAL